MRTCPNCHYELRGGQTECPMCGTHLPRPAKRAPSATGALVTTLIVVVAVVGAAAAVARRNPQARVGTAAECDPSVEAEQVEKPRFSKPTLALDPGKQHTLVFETSCGEITIALDVKRAPKTASSVAFLAGKGFFDGLPFHRVVPGFVVQGGDPAGNGTGGPGYTVVEPPPKDLQYEPGVVAMAKTQMEPPGASGSQFFIVSGPNAAGLPAEYALVGVVASGMDVVKEIERFAAPSQTAPPKTVLIERARVESR